MVTNPAKRKLSQTGFSKEQHWYTTEPVPVKVESHHSTGHTMSPFWKNSLQLLELTFDGCFNNFNVFKYFHISKEHSMLNYNEMYILHTLLCKQNRIRLNKNLTRNATFLFSLFKSGGNETNVMLRQRECNFLRKQPFSNVEKQNLVSRNSVAFNPCIFACNCQ